MTIEEYRITRNETIRQSNMERYGFGPNVMRNIRVCPECGTRIQLIKPLKFFR